MIRTTIRRVIINSSVLLFFKFYPEISVNAIISFSTRNRVDNLLGMDFIPYWLQKANENVPEILTLARLQISLRLIYSTI